MNTAMTTPYQVVDEEEEEEGRRSLQYNNEK